MKKKGSSAPCRHFLINLRTRLFSNNMLNIWILFVSPSVWWWWWWWWWHSSSNNKPRSEKKALKFSSSFENHPLRSSDRRTMSSSVDEIYKRMKDDTEANEIVCGSSDLRNYFTGKNVLFTGATGFMGKCFVEKILRECQDIGKLYLLVRQKKGVSPDEKIKKYFQNFVSADYCDTLYRTSFFKQCFINLQINIFGTPAFFIAFFSTKSWVKIVLIVFYTLSVTQYSR